MTGTWQIIIKGGTLAGVLGPSLGVLLVMLAKIVRHAGTSESQATLSLLTLLSTTAVYWVYAIIFFGPVAALLGAFGTWILLRALRRATPLPIVRAIGIGAGALFGAACPWLTIAMVSMSLSSGLSPVKERLMEGPDLQTVVGVIVGATIGLSMTVLVVRSRSHQT